MKVHKRGFFKDPILFLYFPPNLEDELHLQRPSSLLKLYKQKIPAYKSKQELKKKKKGGAKKGEKTLGCLKNGVKGWGREGLSILIQNSARRKKSWDKGPRKGRKGDKLFKTPCC